MVLHYHLGPLGNDLTSTSIIPSEPLILGVVDLRGGGNGYPALELKLVEAATFAQA